MSKAEKTRDFIIEKAAPLFNTKGYVGTSMADVMEATGLTKGSIYGNFENKDDVAAAVFAFNVNALNSRLDESTSGQHTPSGKLLAIVDYYRNNWKGTFERGGCPILNAAVEADDNLPFLKKDVQESIKKWVIKISRIIDEGKKDGTFRKEISSTEYAYSVITLIEGGIMLAKIEHNPKRLFLALDRVIRILKEEIEK